MAEAEPLYLRFLQLDPKAVEPDNMSEYVGMANELFDRVGMHCKCSMP
jgi:hypothetical protein